MTLYIIGSFFLALAARDRVNAIEIFPKLSPRSRSYLPWPSVL